MLCSLCDEIDLVCVLCR